MMTQNTDAYLCCTSSHFFLPSALENYPNMAPIPGFLLIAASLAHVTTGFTSPVRFAHQRQRGNLLDNSCGAQDTVRAKNIALSDMLTAEQEQSNLLEVFSSFDTDESGTISVQELSEMLRVLEIEASEEEAQALFQVLDNDGDGEVGFEDFLPWYSEISGKVNNVSHSFRSLLVGRRTVGQFDETPVSDGVLRRAVECAVAAPNRSMSEPWRFIKVGPETVKKFAELKKRLQKNMETDLGSSSVFDWTSVPGWCVVTSKLSPDEPEIELEDFRSTSCAVQNFMLSMWSEGIGTKWTSGPVQKTQEFAHLCGIDTEREKVIGCIWYGFATGGLMNADPKRRKKGVDDVLSSLP